MLSYRGSGMDRVSCEVSFAKYWVLFFNLFFALAGLSLFLFGIYDQYKSSDYLDDFGGGDWYTAPGLLISIGAIIFIIAFCGCCGAVNESACKILIFALLLCVIIVLEMSIGIAGLINREEMKKLMSEKLNHTLHQHEEYKRPWQWIQTEFECCGVTGPDDWLLVFPNGTLPSECCKNLKPDSECTRQDEGGVVEIGCQTKIIEYIDGKIFIISCVGIVLAIFQVVCLGFSFILYKAF